MPIHVDLTMDCADPRLLAAFWKIAAGYVDEPPPAWARPGCTTRQVSHPGCA